MIALTATKTLLDVIVNRFQNEKQLLVYGAGRNAGIFCSSMKDSACQLVFFDRRAEKEEFFFDGRRVFPPREMLNYPGAPVLVTPFSLQEKIIEQIAGMGIEKSRIYAFPRDPEVPAGISMLTLSDDPESVYRLGPPIPFTRDLFSAAMDRITDWDLTDYPVISSEGEMLFFLHVSWLNTLSQCDNAGLSVVVPNLYPGGELKKVLEQLDLSLLSAYDGYVFEEVEGYTFALTELILSLWPERPVWYRDSRAALFWGSEQVTILPDNDDSELPRNRNLMTVSSGRTFQTFYGTRAVERHFFDSIQVMGSLCWARDIRKLGEKNPEKTIFIIDTFSQAAGMGDLIKIVQTYAGAARERGWTPVARLHNTQYSDEPEKDLWSRWFAPLSEVPLEDALHSARVILGAENRTSITGTTLDYVWNPYLEYYLRRQSLRLSDELSRRFERSTDAKPDESTLGVVIRGSDLLTNWDLMNKLDLTGLLARVLSIRSNEDFRKVFLATEEEETLSVFRAALGEDLLFVDQKRVHGYKKGDPLIYLHLQPPVGKRTDWGEKYLYILWCLSRCNSLVYNMDCGAVEISLRLKKGQGERYRLKHVL